VRNAEVVLLAGGDESAAGDGAADGAAGVTVKDDAAQMLDNSQMSWVYCLVTQAFANLIVDINSLTFRVEMLRRVPAEADPAAAAAGDASAAAALEPQRPRHAERRRRCWLSLKNGQVVEATPAEFGPTIEALANLIVSSFTLRTNELHCSFESLQSSSTKGCSSGSGRNWRGSWPRGSRSCSAAAFER